MLHNCHSIWPQARRNQFLQYYQYLTQEDRGVAAALAAGAARSRGP